MPLPDFRLSALPLRTVNSSRPRVAKSPRPKSVMSQPRRARMTSPARCLLRFQSSTDQLANSGSLNPKEAMNFSPSRMISFNSDRFMRYLQTRQPGARRVHAASYSEGRDAAPPSGDPEFALRVEKHRLVHVEGERHRAVRRHLHVGAHAADHLAPAEARHHIGVCAGRL